MMQLNSFWQRFALLQIALMFCASQITFAEAQDVTITTITGDEINATLSSIARGELVGDEIPDGTNLENVMAIRTKGVVAVQTPKVAVFLTDGGRINASSVTYKNENFTIATDFGAVSLTPDAVKGLLFRLPFADQSAFGRALANRSTESDRVIAESPKGEQSALGLLESITSDKVFFNYKDESRSISISRMIGIVAADLRPPPLAGVIGTISLTEGSTVRGSIDGLESGKLSIGLAGRQSISIPMTSVSAISIASDRVVYLSDLTPLEVEQNALATLDFPWKRDLSVAGNPIRLNNSKLGTSTTFSKGLGVHSANRLEFANEGFDRFAATVGIDAETGGRGHCEVSVWADGIKLWSETITGTTDPKNVDVEIDGLERIALVVQNGQHLDLGDHVDWADARFLKTK